MKRVIALTISMLGLVVSGPASALVVDGNLVDWGVQKNIGAAGWTPTAGIRYTVEDQNSSYLDPGYGGQAYDAEAMYATISGGKLFVGLATGHNPLTVNNPAGNSYGAGDFAIDFGKNGSYELGINMKHVIGSGGATEAFGVLGGVYGNASWNLGLWNAAGAHDPAHADPKHPVSLKAGSYLGNAAFSYSTVGQSGYGQYASATHYFYEMSVDLSMLLAGGWDGTSSFNVHWTELCANDAIIVDTPAYVPEPATLATFAVALLAMVTLRRRLARAKS